MKLCAAGRQLDHDHPQWGERPCPRPGTQKLVILGDSRGQRTVVLHLCARHDKLYVALIGDEK